MQTLLNKFIFSNKPATRIFRHLCFWVCWYIYQVVLFLYNNSNIQNDFWLNLEVRCLKLLKAFPIGIVQCYVVVYWLIPHFLLKKKYLLFIFLFILVVAAEIYLVDIVTYSSFEFLPVWLGIVSYISRAGPILYLLFFIFKMLKTWYIKQWEKDTLVKENLDAELQLLKAQIHPHFLFNTLNNIYSFILTNPPHAQILIQNLEKLLRYMIYECEQSLVPLNKELSMLNDYIELEKVRYGNQLDVKVAIGNTIENKLITPLLLIPFVENSFKHGTSKMLREPWIRLYIQTDEDVLHFSLTNSKPIEEIVHKKGIGLKNVKQRLELLYPEKHLLKIESTPNTFTINMQIPIYKVEQKSIA